MVSFVVSANLVAAGNAQDLYLAAKMKEKAVRAVLAAEGRPIDPTTVLADVRTAVAAYREIVRLYPASTYGDDALWLAGRLSLDAFARFGEQQDRTTGIRLLELLTTRYPRSSFVKRVPEQLQRFADNAAPPAPIPSVPIPWVAIPWVAIPSAPTPPAPAAPIASQAPASATPKQTAIKAIRRVVLTDAVRVVIELDGEVGFRDERINGPARVLLDLPATRAVPALGDQTLRFDGDSDIVKQVRIGRQADGTTRVVLDAAGVSSYSVYPLYSPYRLVIDCVRGPEPRRGAPAPLVARAFDIGMTRALPTPSAGAGALIAAALAPPPVLTSRKLTTEWGGTLPASGPTRSAAIAAALVPPPPPPAKAAASPADNAAALVVPDKNLTGGFSMARQLGLGVSRIVIDPGHGGHDPGAKGKGVDEAELVLDIALRIEKLFQQVPDTEVILTRRTDEFVALQERTALANREGADLFLSIHANGSTNVAARGVETYFLNFATNLDAASVAARENAASGQAMGALPDFVKAIALNNKLDESRDFATQVQHAMTERLRDSNKELKDLGVKQAPFVVLIGAAMPSVLAEIAFVTNPQEAKLLRNNAYRQRIAESLFDATRKYQTSLQKVATVAHDH
jgi:N-acetylmuramoyl-L-alanine amidase